MGWGKPKFDPFAGGEAPLAIPELDTGPTTPPASPFDPFAGGEAPLGVAPRPIPPYPPGFNDLVDQWEPNPREDDELGPDFGAQIDQAARASAMAGLGGMVAPPSPQVQAAVQAHLKSLPDPVQMRDTDAAGAPRPEVSFASLMAGLPLRQGGGSVTNSVITPGEAAALKDRMASATSDEKSAQLAKSGIGQAMYRELASNDRERASAQAAMFKAHEAKRAEMDARVEAQMADNARMLEEIKKTHLDPERRYKGEGGGLRRFMDGLAVALGTMGASLLRQPNTALEIVNRRLDQDMKAQMADLANKKFVYQAGRNLLTDLYARTHDMQQSFLLGKAAYLDIAKAQVDALTRGAQSEEAVQNGQLAVAALDKAQVQNEMQLKKLAYRQVTSTSGGFTPAAQLAMKAVVGQRLQGAGLAPSAQGKTLPAEQVMNVASMKAQLDEAGKLFREATKGGTGVVPMYMGWINSKFPGTEAEAYDSWRKSFALTMSAAMNQGRPTDKDTEMILGMVPRMGDPSAELKVRRLIGLGRKKLLEMEKASGQGGYSTGAFK